MGEVTLEELLYFNSSLWTSQADKWLTNARELARQGAELHAAADHLARSLTGPAGQKAEKALRDRANELVKASETYIKVGQILHRGATRMNELKALAESLKKQVDSGGVSVHDDGQCTPRFTLNPFEIARRISLARSGTAGMKHILKAAAFLDRLIAEALRTRESLPPVSTSETGPIDISIEAIQAAAETNAQGGWRNCVQLASLRALAATNPKLLQDHVEWDADKGAYVVTLWDPDTGEKKNVYVDPTTLTDASRDSKDPQKLTIFDIYEQALIAEDPTHSGEILTDGFKTITGEDAQSTNSTNDVIDAVRDGKAVTAGGSTQDYTDSSVPEEKRLVPRHAYHVKEVTAEGNIILENPWGPEGSRSEGMHFPGQVELTPEEYDEWIGHSAIANT